MNRNDFLHLLRQSGKNRNIPNISPETETVLRFFLLLLKPQRVLEMGSANGYSTVFMGDILEEWGGEILSLERSLPSFTEAEENVKKAGLQNVTLRLGDAFSLLSPEDGLFDFLFIDAEKKQTHRFWEFGATFLAPGGIICIDDVRLFPEKMAPFYKMLEEKKEEWIWEEIPTEKGDAVMILTKRGV